MTGGQIITCGAAWERYIQGLQVSLKIHYCRRERFNLCLVAISELGQGSDFGGIQSPMPFCQRVYYEVRVWHNLSQV